MIPISRIFQSDFFIQTKRWAQNRAFCTSKSGRLHTVYPIKNIYGLFAQNMVYYQQKFDDI